MNRKDRISPSIAKGAPWIFILLLLLIILISLATVCLSQSPKPAPKKAETAIQVKIPDGLYLYKPNFTEDAFSPLVLVKNRKLIDPYALTQKYGFEAFMKENVIERTFNVYVGSEKFGQLKNLGFPSTIPAYHSAFYCRKDEFVPNIRGNGSYEGKPLPSGWLTEKEMWDQKYKIYGSTKILIAPQSYQGPKNQVLFAVTNDDMQRMTEAVRKHLVPREIEEINKTLSKEKRRVIGESKSRLDVIEAFDLDGNGEKDLVGIYYLSVVHDNPQGYWPHDILFVLWDMGKVEKIACEDGSPTFVLGGAIDIDQDGLQELIVTSHVTSKHEDGGDGRQMDILRRGPSGWKSIFRSRWICDIGLFYD